MSGKTFQVSMYSIKELPQELRAEFKLPAYPFVSGPSGPLPAVVTEFFQKYGIVYYRDEMRPYGIGCQPLDDDETLIYDRTGFTAYRSSAILLWTGMRIVSWNPTADPGKYRRIVKKFGDDCAWTMWNRPVVVQEMNEQIVRAI